MADGDPRFASGSGRPEQLRPDAELVLESDVELQPPRLFRVLLHNDDFTPMDFVVRVLMEIFGFDRPLSHKLMLQVHQEGWASAGTYPYDVAETKVARVTGEARASDYPLRCSVEPE